MRLSALQKHILIECINHQGGKISRSGLGKTYLIKGKKPQTSSTKIITRSLERLINKELLIGYGIRTPHKWFIQEIKLTRLGKKQAQKLLGEQMKFKL